MSAEVQSKDSKLKRFFRRLWRIAKKHPVVALCIVGLFVASFFMRAESIEVRYSGESVYEYVRIDYSIYGYCVNVIPVNSVSDETAGDLTRILLFADTKDSIDKVVALWSDYHGPDQQFQFRVRGYFCDAMNKRGKLIEYVKQKGFAADALT